MYLSNVWRDSRFPMWASVMVTLDALSENHILQYYLSLKLFRATVVNAYTGVLKLFLHALFDTYLDHIQNRMIRNVQNFELLDKTPI